MGVCAQTGREEEPIATRQLDLVRDSTVYKESRKLSEDLQMPNSPIERILAQCFCLSMFFSKQSPVKCFTLTYDIILAMSDIYSRYQLIT